MYKKLITLLVVVLLVSTVTTVVARRPPGTRVKQTAKKTEVTRQPSNIPSPELMDRLAFNQYLHRIQNPANNGTQARDKENEN